MTRKEYSAGAVKHSFWFSEFKKVINLIVAGNSMNDIKSMSEQSNIFSAPTKASASRIYNTVSLRIISLTQELYPLFYNGDLSTQKIITLISIMNTDSLFFDFVYEVYREKIIIGDDQLLNSDTRIFFKNKQLQSERVAGWQDRTLQKLGSGYKLYLVEAGAAARPDATHVLITKPILDASLVDCLIKNDMGRCVSALTGV